MNNHDSNHAGVGHVAPLWVLAAVCLFLIFMTWLTVAATHVNFGDDANLAIAMGIATVKASFVILFFMHLYWDKKLHAMIFIGTLIFVALFIMLSLMDSYQYQPNLIKGYAPLINK
ncbi:MAG: hypothetical protein GC154_00755 [bacterium]|nr:hypothetical protein [bacterium]